MTIQAVYDGVKDRLDTIPGLTAYSFQPSAGTYPCAFPTLPTVDYHAAMRRGLETLEVNVALLLAGQESTTRTSNLIAYIEPSGTKSIITAIYGDTTLGGAASDCIVRGFEPFGLDELAAYQAIGGLFPMTVLLA